MKVTNLGLRRWRSHNSRTYWSSYCTPLSVWQSEKLFCMRAILISGLRSISFITKPRSNIYYSLTKLGLHCWKLSSKLISLSSVSSAVGSGQWAIWCPIPLDSALIFDKTQCLVNFWLPLALYNASNNGFDINNTDAHKSCCADSCYNQIYATELGIAAYKENLLGWQHRLSFGSVCACNLNPVNKTKTRTNFQNSYPTGT